jgi:hypothetical protein
MSALYRDVIVRTCRVTPQRATLVEAWLLLQHGTLDHLSRVEIKRAYDRGISQAIDADVEQSIRLAQSFGLSTGAQS